MKRENSERKLDPYKMAEEKLEEFSKRISKIERSVSEIKKKTRKSFQEYSIYLEHLGKTIYYDTLILFKINELRGYSTDGIPQLFNTVVERIKQKNESIKEIENLGMKIPHLDTSFYISDLVELSKKWNLPFEDIASYLIAQLGKQQAREVVEKEVIMQLYGKDVIPIWEMLLKE